MPSELKWIVLLQEEFTNLHSRLDRLHMDVEKVRGSVYGLEEWVLNHADESESWDPGPSGPAEEADLGPRHGQLD